MKKLIKSITLWIVKILSMFITFISLSALLIFIAVIVYMISTQTHHGFVEIANTDRILLLYSMNIIIASLLTGVLGLHFTKVI